jgi:hypothetical protein
MSHPQEKGRGPSGAQVETLNEGRKLGPLLPRHIVRLGRSVLSPPST